MSPLLTVIIPTYNRAEFLFRTLQFLQTGSSRFPIIVADGSDENVAQKNAECTRIGDEISYFYTPARSDEIPSVNYRRRMLAALDQVKTPYSVFCADDSLLVPESALLSARFLEDNTDYIGCHGIYLQYRYSHNRLQIQGVEFEGDSLDSENFSSRLMQLFSRYESPFYAVFRAPINRILLDRYAEAEQPLWPEIYHSTAAIIEGKIKRLDNIYALRHTGIAPLPHQMASFDQWVLSDFDSFFARYRKFRDKVAEWEFNGKLSDADRNKLHRLIDTVFMLYIGKHYDAKLWIDRCLEASILTTDEMAQLRNRLEKNLIPPKDEPWKAPTIMAAIKLLAISLLGARGVRIYQDIRDSLFGRRDAPTIVPVGQQNSIEIVSGLKEKLHAKEWEPLSKIPFPN